MSPNQIFDGLSFYFDTFPLKNLTKYVALKVTPGTARQKTYGQLKLKK